MYISEKIFHDKILYDGIIKDCTLNFGKNEISISDFKGDNIELENCDIIADTITFENIRNKNLYVRFINCNVEAELIFRNCIFHSLEFKNIQNIKSLKLNKGYEDENVFELHSFHFSNDKESNNFIETNFYLRDCFFINEFAFDNIKHKTGNFIFERNKIGKLELQVDNEYYTFRINKSIINNACFAKNNFNSLFFITECILNFKEVTRLKYKNTLFWQNIFDKIAFQKTVFNGKTLFATCQFKDIAYFENIENIENSELTFIDCRFEKYTSFTGAQIESLSLEKTIFQDIVSFQNTIFKNLMIDKPHFDKLAYFDGIKIGNVYACDIRTLRNIKQQLQKAENKIDYNRFRAYELAAYYKELNWQQNFKDKFILGATWLVTGFDHSWRRALLFTIISGFIWYSILYRIENTGSFNPERIEDFFNGSYRFFLVTDFYSPFEHEKRIYLENGWSGLVMIIGKIFIAFGIYEMIQAFRKFKA